jgi:hypothetical protein
VPSKEYAFGVARENYSQNACCDEQLSRAKGNSQAGAGECGDSVHVVG